VLCRVFVLCFCLSSSCDLCVQCYQCLWIVHAWLPLWFYLAFIYQLEGRVQNKSQPGETKQHQWNRFKQYNVTIHQRPVFSGVRVIRSLVLYVCFVDRCLSFCTFSFASVLSVLPRYMDSDYPFGIFKLFLQNNKIKCNFNRLTELNEIEINLF